MRDESFAEFAVHAAQPLIRLARVLAGNEHDACDLVQDTLVRVGTRWSRVRSDGNPLGYARVVLTDWLTEAWGSLSPHQRTAVGLRYLEDLEVSAIAELMGCGATTVRSHISRGLARVRGFAPQLEGDRHE